MAAQADIMNANKTSFTEKETFILGAQSEKRGSGRSWLVAHPSVKSLCLYCAMLVDAEPRCSIAKVYWGGQCGGAVLFLSPQRGSALVGVFPNSTPLMSRTGGRRFCVVRSPFIESLQCSGIQIRSRLQAHAQSVSVSCARD